MVKAKPIENKMQRECLVSRDDVAVYINGNCFSFGKIWLEQKVPIFFLLLLSLVVCLYTQKKYTKDLIK